MGWQVVYGTCIEARNLLLSLSACITLCTYCLHRFSVTTVYYFLHPSFLFFRSGYFQSDKSFFSSPFFLRLISLHSPIFRLTYENNEKQTVHISSPKPFSFQSETCVTFCNTPSPQNVLTFFFRYRDSLFNMFEASMSARSYTSFAH
jgi:hypothetical protein